MEIGFIKNAVGTGEKGHCREWIRSALLVLDTNFKSVKVDIREVQIEPTVYHSFIRAIYRNISFFLDGTGFGKHEPYFGLEADAPPHLQKGKRDMINSYR